ncbi:hypothetical protein A3K93_12775 [Acinetobacter sp. NCu2D-2]|nr:hypothetical protein A3K93_12775 [Acinetobacter sp. NCu2D-2]
MWYKLRLWLQNPSENLWLNPALGAIFAIFFSLFATVSRYFLTHSHHFRLAQVEDSKSKSS